MKPTTSDTLLQACGVEGSLTVLVTGPGENDRRKVSIERSFVLVGRHPRSCVVLDDKRIGSRHLYLQILGGQLYGIDLGQSSGVYRGLTRFTTGWAPPRCFFRLGPYHVSAQFAPASLLDSFTSDDPISHRSTDPRLFPPLSADVLVGNVRHSRWKMTRRLVLVGRDPSVRLRLRDRSISRFHAALVGTPSGIWVVDLLSREGTWVNGSRVPCARLLSGDRLRLGCYDLYLRIDESVSRPALPAPVPSTPGSGQALIPSGVAGLPAAQSVAALSPEASALLPVLQQFGVFQQQMLDQFQQSLMMMLQTFAKMNSDQMELIREELAELRRLTEELHVARQQLDVAAVEPAPVQTPVAPAPAWPGRTPSPSPMATPILPPVPEGPPDADVHAWLSSQIASLESRREGVLKRILRKITGA